MCGRYRLAREERALAEHFDVEEWHEIRIPFRVPRFNVAPTQVVPAVRWNAAARRELVPLRWGLVPHWAKEPDTGYRTINARAETWRRSPPSARRFGGAAASSPLTASTNGSRLERASNPGSST